MTRHEWRLKRNCSLSPRQLACAYAMLCLATFGIAVLCALRGAWPVLLFSILEMTVVALAFLHYARHATDQEHIVLQEGLLLVERVQAGHIQQIFLDPYWTRIALPKKSQDLINLESRGVKIEVGRFVTEEKRLQVARELRLQLRGGLFSPT